MNKALQAVKSIASKISTWISPVASKLSNKLSVVITKAADTKIGKFIVRNRPDRASRGLLVIFAVVAEVLARVFRGGTPLRNLRKAFTDYRGMPYRAFDFVLQVCLNLLSAAWAYYFVTATLKPFAAVLSWVFFIGALIFAMERAGGRNSNVGNRILRFGVGLIKFYALIVFGASRIYGYRPHWLKAKLVDADIRYARKAAHRDAKVAERRAADQAAYDELIALAEFLIDNGQEPKSRKERWAIKTVLKRRQKAQNRKEMRESWEAVKEAWRTGYEAETTPASEEVVQAQTDQVAAAKSELEELITSTQPNSQVTYDSAKEDKELVQVHLNGAAARMQPRVYGKELADDVVKQPVTQEAKVTFRKVLPRKLRAAGVNGKELTWLLQAYDSRMSELVAS